MIKCGEGATAAGVRGGSRTDSSRPPIGPKVIEGFVCECVVEVIRQLRFGVVLVSHHLVGSLVCFFRERAKQVEASGCMHGREKGS
jgi:hypothetical protein